MKPRRAYPRSQQKVLAVFLPLIALIWASISADAASAENPNDILIIVNRSVKANKIEIDELKDIFLKKRTNWSSGERAVPLNVASDPKLREEFRASVLNMSATEEKRYWQTRKIKGGDGEPAEFGNVLKAVYKLHGAVSYIYRSDYKEGIVKVVFVLEAGK